jgi:hypothetical protein
VRVAEDGRQDVLDTARSVLLQEVTSHIDDPVRGAALMGVTLRTYRRWTQELGSPSPDVRETPLLPVGP